VSPEKSARSLLLANLADFGVFDMEMTH